MSDSTQRKVETTYAELLQSRLGSVSGRLRSLADACDRAGAEVARVFDGGRPNYGDVVGTVQHEILWGVANLSLDGLVSLARDADEVRLIQRVREKIASEIEAKVGGYPDNEVARPKVARGGHVNDVAWAALIARQQGEG